MAGYNLIEAAIPRNRIAKVVFGKFKKAMRMKMATIRSGLIKALLTVRRSRIEIMTVKICKLGRLNLYFCVAI
jgi:hypothetical protein